jgi:hypothetical protein
LRLRATEVTAAQLQVSIAKPRMLIGNGEAMLRCFREATTQQLAGVWK